MYNIKLENTRTTVNTVVIGKEYLKDIIKEYVEDNEDILKELDYIIFTIGDKENVDSFHLHKDIRVLFDNDDTYTEFVEQLNRYLAIYDDFGKYFMYHTRNILRELDKLTNEPKCTIHNYLKLLPKEPDEYANFTDHNTTYNSIMSKLYLKNYNKYVDENDNGASAWTFQISFTYLIIIDKLYRLLEPFVPDAISFLYSCLTKLNPIIVGLTYTTEITSDMKALEIIYELMQLTSSGSQLTIKKSRDKSEVDFIFTTEKGTFTNYEYQKHKAMYRLDSKGKRKVQLNITGNGNKLFLKIDIIGLQSIQDITHLACNPLLFSANTDESTLKAFTYEIFGTMLSHTKEFQLDLDFCNKKAQELVNSGDVKGMGSERDIIDSTSEMLLRKCVFKNLKHENLLRPLMYLQENHPLQRYSVIYYRHVVSGLNMTRSELSEMLKDIGSKQQAEIRNMISIVKSLNYKGIPALHNLFKSVTYRS